MDLSHLISSTKDSQKYSKFLKNVLTQKPTLIESIELSQKFNLALHPNYILIWQELSPQRAIDVFIDLQTIKKSKEFVGFEIQTTHKRDLELIGIEHKWLMQENNVDTILINDEILKALITNLGDINWVKNNLDLNKIIEIFKQFEKLSKENLDKSFLDIINSESKITIRDKAGSYIGARMGRPEKAKMRKLDGRPQGLFMIGNGRKVKSDKKIGDSEEYSEIIQNRMRNIIEAYEGGTVFTEFRPLQCTKCGEESLYRKCIYCGGEAKPQTFNRYDGSPVKEDNELAVQYKRQEVELKEYVDIVRRRLQLTELPKMVKGIRGTANEHRTIEVLDKAFLRAKHDVYVNKDGTVRYDMIEMGLTHFKPNEIGTSVEKLKKLGYTHDYLGNELTDMEQVIEIFPQDVVLPDCEVSGEEKASDVMLRTGNFIDEMLQKVYNVDPFYNFKSKEDTIGHILIGLAPHTSAGIVGRIIGYSKTQGCFSHPVWHAAQRRNLDGDENGVMLLLDGLLNGSREFLPNRRGSKTMDVSLVLTSHLYLDQIDDEVHGMDIVPYYPLDFYKACKEFASPKSVKIEKVDARLDVEELDKRYLGYKFTHDNTNLNDTVLCSAYKTVPSMAEKLELQLEIGRKIRAVDENKVGELVIDKHFMKDIKGNLRKFGMQSFRCTSCNTSFRRPPLNGRCTNCFENSINFTIHEGSIKKYLAPSFKIAKDFNIDPYIVETLDLVNLRMEGVFGKELEKQKSLSGFFG